MSNCLHLYFKLQAFVCLNLKTEAILGYPEIMSVAE